MRSASPSDPRGRAKLPFGGTLAPRSHCPCCLCQDPPVRTDSSWRVAMNGQDWSVPSDMFVATPKVCATHSSDFWEGGQDELSMLS